MLKGSMEGNPNLPPAHPRGAIDWMSDLIWEADDAQQSLRGRNFITNDAHRYQAWKDRPTLTQHGTWIGHNNEQPMPLALYDSGGQAETTRRRMIIRPGHVDTTPVPAGGQELAPSMLGSMPEGGRSGGSLFTNSKAPDALRSAERRHAESVDVARQQAEEQEIAERAEQDARAQQEQRGCVTLPAGATPLGTEPVPVPIAPPGTFAGGSTKMSSPIRAGSDATLVESRPLFVEPKDVSAEVAELRARQIREAQLVLPVLPDGAAHVISREAMIDAQRVDLGDGVSASVPVGVYVDREGKYVRDLKDMAGRVGELQTLISFSTRHELEILRTLGLLAKVMAGQERALDSKHKQDFFIGGIQVRSDASNRQFVTVTSKLLGVTQRVWTTQNNGYRVGGCDLATTTLENLRKGFVSVNGMYDLVVPNPDVDFSMVELIQLQRACVGVSCILADEVEVALSRMCNRA